MIHQIEHSCQFVPIQTTGGTAISEALEWHVGEDMNFPAHFQIAARDVRARGPLSSQSFATHGTA